MARPAAKGSAWDRPAIPRPAADAAPPGAAFRRVVSAATPASAASHRLADEALLLVVHDGSARLIDLAGDVVALSESAAALLESALGTGADLALLAARYRVPEARLAADRDALLADLARRGAIRPAGATARRRPFSRALEALLRALVRVLARRPAANTRAKARRLATLAFVATRLAGWSGAVRAWDAAFAPADGGAGAGGDDAALLDAVDAGVGAAIAGHWLRVGCKERALAAWALARAGGQRARLTLGVDLFPFGLHCWCEAGGRILADRYEGRCDRYAPIVSHGA